MSDPSLISAMDTATWASQIAALAADGAVAPATPYDADRYQRLAEIAGVLSHDPAIQESQDTSSRQQASALAARTPRVAADAAVFDAAGRILLIQRRDSALWALPGGAAEVNNLPAAAAQREVWEETGIIVYAERLIGLYAMPSRDGSPGYPLYILLFLCHRIAGEPIVTHESLAVGYFGPDALPPLHRGHAQRIADAYAALRGGRAWPTVYR